MTPADLDHVSPEGGFAFRSAEVAAMLKGELIGPDNLVVSRLGSIETDGPGTLSFIRSAKFAKAWASSKVEVALVSAGIEVPGHDPATRALIVVPDADLALIGILQHLTKPRHSGPPGVHPNAVVDPSASIADTCTIGPLCSVGPGASIGEGTTLAANVTIGARVKIGARCNIRPTVVIEDDCIIGDDCTLDPGVIIGADGFGYRKDPQSSRQIKVPHAGNVIIGDRVDIGPNTCVDRGKFGPTTIGSGTKIDNLCQIAHNVTIGEDCLICGQTALAGSVRLGNRVTLAGQVGVADSVTIGDDAIACAYAGIIKRIGPGEVWGGQPAMPYSEYAASIVAVRKLARKRLASHRFPHKDRDTSK